MSACQSAKCYRLRFQGGNVIVPFSCTSKKCYVEFLALLEFTEHALLTCGSNFTDKVKLSTSRRKGSAYLYMGKYGSSTYWVIVTFSSLKLVIIKGYRCLK